jgi:hypothetical protein
MFTRPEKKQELLTEFRSPDNRTGAEPMFDQTAKICCGEGWIRSGRNSSQESFPLRAENFVQGEKWLENGLRKSVSCRHREGTIVFS